MAIDHHRDDLVTHPGSEVGATSPGQSKTREENNNTTQERLARFLTRRRLLGATGAVALVLALGGGYVAARGESAPAPAATTDTNRDTPTNGPETGPVFEKDLALSQMKLPERLDAPTYGEITQNVGLAIQYAVNYGDAALIRRLIPGAPLHVLQPDQFELRAAFLEGYRKSSEGTMNDDPNDPHNTKYYPWGFEMKMLEQLNRHNEDPADPKVTYFSARVQVTVGDLPPLTTDNTTFARLEPARTFEAEALFTRVVKLNKDGTYNIPPDLNGQGRGWSLGNISQMYPVPPIMTNTHLPEGFTEVPDLYKK